MTTRNRLLPALAALALAVAARSATFDPASTAVFPRGHRAAGVYLLNHLGTLSIETLAQQVHSITVYAPTEPHARLLAAVFASPSLLEKHKVALTSWLGPDGYKRLRTWSDAVQLQQKAKPRKAQKLIDSEIVHSTLLQKGIETFDALEAFHRDADARNAWDGTAFDPSSTAVFPRGHQAAAIALLNFHATLDYMRHDQQIEAIAAAVPSTPEAGILAAGALSPDLLEKHAPELSAWLGPDGYKRLRNWGKWLHDESPSTQGPVEKYLRMRSLLIETRIFEKGVGLLMSLRAAHEAASAPTPEPAATKTPSAGDRAPLVPALTWPVHPGEAGGRERRVHALDAADGRWLVNGKPAENLREGLLVHPDDPDLVVHVHHSAGSLEAYERNSAALERLTPLSAAGAAPRLVEHGEAAVSGLGRVFFHVQERLRGNALGSLAERPLEAVEELFGRLAKAGLELIVPKAGRDWLLSHIAVGTTRSGGRRAYVLDGAAAAGTPESAAAHYRMLRSLLDGAAADSEPRAGEIRDAASKAPLHGKLQRGVVPSRAKTAPSRGDRKGA